MTQLLQQTIDAAWENRAQISPAQAPADVREAVRHVLAELDAGRLRVATREGVGQWTVHMVLLFLAMIWTKNEITALFEFDPLKQIKLRGMKLRWLALNLGLHPLVIKNTGKNY